MGVSGTAIEFSLRKGVSLGEGRAQPSQNVQAASSFGSHSQLFATYSMLDLLAKTLPITSVMLSLLHKTFGQGWEPGILVNHSPLSF